MQHPFFRNTFTTSSLSEIAIIRKHRLTKLFYDPDRSNAAALAALTNPALEVNADLNPMWIVDIEDDEKALQRRKAAHIETACNYRHAQEVADRNYSDMTKQCSQIIAMANTGQADSVQLASQFLASMLHQLMQPGMALQLVQTGDLDDPEQELTSQAVNVSVLSSRMGVLLKLSQEESQHLGLSAIFHNVGLNKFLAPLMAKRHTLAPAELKYRRLYPQIGRDTLEAVPGMPQEIVQIVYQHCEYLDGSVMPRGLVNGDTVRLARMMGTVVKYDRLTRLRDTKTRLTPAQTLSHLYVNMKHKLGLDVVEPFIASMTVYPLGSFVEISDGSIGLVVKVNAEERMRPVVKLYDPSTSHQDAAVVDLSRERSLSIRKNLDLKSTPQEAMDILSPGGIVGYTLAPALA